MNGQDTARYYVGTSGWHYEHWRERFYPHRLGKPRWLNYYAQFFNTVELNASFYRLPTENAFRSWYAGSPPGFLFAVKASRLITHYRRLLGVEELLASFLGRARLMGEKLGPILYQLPPDLPRDDARLAAFLDVLPPGFRHTIEFRHASWFAPAVLDALAAHSVGFCVVSMVGLESPIAATAPFAYVRFHGAAGLYRGLYGEERLAEWGRQIKDLGAGRREVYAYFNNDYEAQAVADARTLRALLGGPTT